MQRSLNFDKIDSRFPLVRGDAGLGIRISPGMSGSDCGDRLAWSGLMLILR